MEQEFKKKISSYKSSIIKDIITLIIKDYYDAYKNEYYFEEIFGEDIKKLSEIYMYTWWEEQGIKSFENYTIKYAPPELYNFFVWKMNNYENFCYEEDEENVSEDHAKDFFEQLENIPIPPEKETIEQEENPFESSIYIDESSSLEDDNDFYSLLKSLETIVSFENELLKRESTKGSENPYQSDWDKINQRIIDAWLKTIIEYKNTINIVSLQKGIEYPRLNFLGISEDNKEQIEELTKICMFKIFLDDNPLYAYGNYYEVWESLAQSNYIDKRKLKVILKELETSTELEKTILNILDRNDGIYFICAVPLMKNLKNKATCIFAFNLIFNSHIEFQEFSKEEKEGFPKYERIIEALNSGLTLSEIPHILERMKSYTRELKEDYILKYGYNPNMQDENGNTLLMNLLITTTANVLNEFLFENYREKILMLLKLDFSLSLQNNEGLNTYDMVMKYRSSDEELVEIISKIYGVPYDRTTIEFYKELARVRSNDMQEKLIKKF